MAQTYQKSFSYGSYYPYGLSPQSLFATRLWIFDMLHMPHSWIDAMARPKTITKQKLVGLTDELAQRIDDFRFTNRFKEETAAIRRLIEIGLQGYEADIRYSGILKRETAEAAELKAYGSGHIFHAGVSAGAAGERFDQIPYQSPAAREIWLKGYIRGTEQRLGGQPATEES